MAANEAMTDEFAPAAASNNINDAENSGPLEDRLASKNWSVRAKAFEELTDLYGGATSPKDGLFHEHGPSWKKYLCDTNPGSLERCLESLTAFIDKGDPAIVSAY
jgi:hypothetical protein